MGITIPKEIYEQMKKARHSMDYQGRDLVNPLPMNVPIGVKRPPSLKEQIQRVIRQEVSYHAYHQGMESIEESEDFDVEDGDEVEEFVSPYEVKDMIPETLNEKPSSSDTATEQVEPGSDTESDSPEEPPA